MTKLEQFIKDFDAVISKYCGDLPVDVLYVGATVFLITAYKNETKYYSYRCCLNESMPPLVFDKIGAGLFFVEN